ncbi:hypothetical protein [Mesorhizobium amorphae]|uniref:hypothetical protein n=1 Tax=Mesorhizobium amorphae TaxID=71433 RepID=UPI0011845407|nr:hypothetical protein [Mesorhizobium amorphae]
MDSVDQSAVEPAGDNTKSRWERFLEADRRLAKRVNAVEKSGIVRIAAAILAVAGIGILVGTGWQILSDYADRSAERVARAWDTVSRPVLGNTGKGGAINTILSSGASIEGLNISCATMGGKPAADTGFCGIAPIISGVEVDGPDPDRPVHITGWNLAGSKLFDSSFKHTFISGINLNGAEVGAVTFEDSHLDGIGDNAIFTDANFVNSEIALAGKGIEFEGQISGTYISLSAPEGMMNVVSWRAWAYADNPPILETNDDATTPYKPVRLGIMVYCDPKTRRNQGEEVAEWVLRCAQMTEDQARQAFPEQWKKFDPQPAL